MRHLHGNEVLVEKVVRHPRNVGRSSGIASRPCPIHRDPSRSTCRAAAHTDQPACAGILLPAACRQAAVRRGAKATSLRIDHYRPEGRFIKCHLRLLIRECVRIINRHLRASGIESSDHAMKANTASAPESARDRCGPHFPLKAATTPGQCLRLQTSRPRGGWDLYSGITFIFISSRLRPDVRRYQPCGIGIDSSDSAMNANATSYLGSGTMGSHSCGTQGESTWTWNPCRQAIFA